MYSLQLRVLMLLYGHMSDENLSDTQVLAGLAAAGKFKIETAASHAVLEHSAQFYRKLYGNACNVTLRDGTLTLIFDTKMVLKSSQ